MEEKTNMEDVLKIMSGQFDMSDFMKEIMDNITKVTQEKLLNGIHQVYNQYKEESMKESNKEINLFNAMKAFVPEHQRGDIDRLTNFLGDVKAITQIMNEIRNKNVNQGTSLVQKPKVKNQSYDVETKKSMIDDSVVIEDNTIYEIDKKCQGRIQMASTQNNIIPLLLMLLLGTSL